MAYRFVQAYHDLGLRKGPIRGFVVHMAEGGGTVEYLSKWNPNGVSVHYVIRYTGEIVQMLREDHMHGSIRANNIRTTSDADGFYGAKAAKAVLGDWATIETTLGPNHATIAVECEGFAATGPNVTQKASLQRLAADVRNRHFVNGNLGHRDFQDYKACPGKLIPWTLLGGHGVFGEEPPKEADMPFNVSPPWAGLSVPKGTVLYVSEAKAAGKTEAERADPDNVTITSEPLPRRLRLLGRYPNDVRVVGYKADGDDYTRTWYVRPGVGEVVRLTNEELGLPEPTPVDCSQAIEDAIATDRLKAQVVWR